MVPPVVRHLVPSHSRSRAPEALVPTSTVAPVDLVFRIPESTGPVWDWLADYPVQSPVWSRTLPATDQLLAKLA